MPTPKVKYIGSQSEIPGGINYVLVRYGDKYEETRHPLGITIIGRPTTIKNRQRAFLLDGRSHSQGDR